MIYIFQTIIVERAEVKQNPDSWPTLEILPGGVIKHAENYESDLASFYQSGDIDNEDGDMMYACAKCPERFKFLFCLVKHVKWHEDQKKKEKQGITGLSKISMYIIFILPLFTVLITAKLCILKLLEENFLVVKISLKNSKGKYGEVILTLLIFNKKKISIILYK